jgi:photosystem II stability/assembly factor-like uncharacterized protein
MAAEEPVPAAPARLASRSLLTSVTATPSGLLFVAGERGHVLISRDGGEHWVQSALPVDVLLTGVCFVDDHVGYLVGHDETILATVDSGDTWRIAHFSAESGQPFLDVNCAADGSVLAVGAYMTLAVSRPPAKNFQIGEMAAAPLQTVHHVARMDDDAELEQPHLNAIARASNGVVYVAGEAGHLYRSEDEGRHWISLPSPYGGSFFSVLALDDSTVLVSGLRGHIYRSIDRGLHWLQIESGTDVLLDGAARLTDGRVLVVGLAGVVLVSDDLGQSFRRLQMSDRKGLAAVANGPKGPIVVGENGVHRLQLESGK